MITKESSSLDSKHGITPPILQVEEPTQSLSGDLIQQSGQHAGDQISMHEIKDETSPPVSNHQLLGLEDEVMKDDRQSNTSGGGIQPASSTQPPIPIELQETTKDSPAKAQHKFEWPLLFERASKNWWHPQFDSHILEQQYWKSLLPRTTKRFQFGLFYLGMVSNKKSILAIFVISILRKKNHKIYYFFTKKWQL